MAFSQARHEAITAGAYYLIRSRQVQPDAEVERLRCEADDALALYAHETGQSMEEAQAELNPVIRVVAQICP